MTGRYKASAPETAIMDGIALGWTMTARGYDPLDRPIHMGGRSPDLISVDVLPTCWVLQKWSSILFLSHLFTVGLWIIPLFYVCGQGLGVLFDCPIRSKSFSSPMDYVMSSSHSRVDRLPKLKPCYGVPI